MDIQETAMTAITTPMALQRAWPEEGVTRVPYWAHTDPQVYTQEMRLIFPKFLATSQAALKNPRGGLWYNAAGMSM